MSMTLKPCPFCGEETRLEIYYIGSRVTNAFSNACSYAPDNYPRDYAAWVECKACGVSTRDDEYPNVTLDEAKKLAADKWNTRAPEQPKQLVQVKPFTDEDREKIKQYLLSGQEKIVCLNCGNTKDTEIITLHAKGNEQISFIRCPMCETNAKE